MADPEKPYEPQPREDSGRIRQPLGSTALIFMAPEVVIDPYETTIFVIDDDDDEGQQKEPFNEGNPSFAANQQDYQLLRRHLRSMKNRRRHGR